MKVVEVIPVAKGLTKPTLTYFTKEKFDPGCFVRIPLKKGSVYGIVASVKDARSAKAAIKGASYPLRKLSTIDKAGKLSTAFMQAVMATAEYYATTPGNVLGTVLPKLFLESPSLLLKFGKEVAPEPREVRLVQLTAEERYREYRSIVRESFAQNSSVMFIVPTKEDALRAQDLLAAGIERYVFTIAKQPPKEVKRLIEEAREIRHPILFITTRGWVAFDRKDLNVFILERENSRAYRTMSRPFINIKVFMEKYAQARGASLILGDSVLSLESLWMEREGRYSELSPLTWRLKTHCEAEVIDMRAKKDFEIFSAPLEHAVKKAVAAGKNVFIYSARKGIASTTICGDCGSLLLCKNCRAPMVLHEAALYICHHCGARRSAETKCDNCQSWKLTPLGLGLDRVAAESKRLFENTDIFVLDKDKAKTAVQVKSITKKFAGSRGAILVGTELALSYLDSVPVIAVASLDPLFSIPDFFINERIFYLITKLRETASEKFIIQTRNVGQEILEYAAAGNVLDFYRSEIKDREELRYPPFGLFVKVSTEDRHEKIEKQAANLLELFKEFDPHFMVEGRGARSQKILSMIMRFDRQDWPKREVTEKLLLLTPDFTVKVDPEGIL